MSDEIQEAPEQVEAHTCQYCGSKTRADIVNMALWEGERLVIITDVPAQICEKCYEQFYEDSALFKIDKLRGTRFPKEKAQEVIEVPVFSLKSVDIRIETSHPVKGGNPKDEETSKFAGYEEL
ncbi:MAG: hypothetical protein A2Z21_06360 [Candidatus Fraserbacteria bacterium RBG_16_55_9]|uniref:YgiT-type zinc finger domain-containing protein n=1 Tax=Fraserbacteria sp. (strain RBG_16_55_9) TaxID=1817864 RepID=A0A1F5UZW9_FRAXR|nr:MAG: hypothetical protein A2Z21_06360 [Candidatus Fraserbacteria bacterium RBG_16_55_9]